VVYTCPILSVDTLDSTPREGTDCPLEGTDEAGDECEVCCRESESMESDPMDGFKELARRRPRRNHVFNPRSLLVGVAEDLEGGDSGP
jgi:hypothetical protein